MLTDESSRSRASCVYVEAVVVAASFGPGVHERFITASRLIPVYFCTFDEQLVAEPRCRTDRRE